MRLSEWHGRATFEDSVSPNVVAVVETALLTLGAEPDPECWVAWGDDPAVRYLIFAPTPSGLDAAAAGIRAFARALFAAVDGRSAPATAKPKASPAKARTRTVSASRTARPTAAAHSATKPGGAVVAKRPAR